MIFTFIFFSLVGQFVTNVICIDLLELIIAVPVSDVLEKWITTVHGISIIL